MIIDRCMNDPSHGRRKIDGINGSKETYLKQNIFIIGTEVSNNEIVSMNVDSIICDKYQ